MERVYPDYSHWVATLPKLTKVWRTSILPEILGRWYIIVCNSSAICYCRKKKSRKKGKRTPFTAITTNVHSWNFITRVCKYQPPFLKCGTVQSVVYFQNLRKLDITSDQAKQNKEVMELKSKCICNSKPKINENMLKIASGHFFHLNCLHYKHMLNNSRTTWLCNICKLGKNPFGQWTVK